LPFLSDDLAPDAVVVAGGTDLRWFTTSLSGYHEHLGTTDHTAFVSEGGSSGHWVMTDSAGGVTTFYGNYDSLSPLQFQSLTDANGTLTEVVSRDTDGQVTEVQRTSGSIVESWLYHYTTMTGSDQELIDNVKFSP